MRERRKEGEEGIDSGGEGEESHSEEEGEGGERHGVLCL